MGCVLGLKSNPRGIKCKNLKMRSYCELLNFLNVAHDFFDIFLCIWQHSRLATASSVNVRHSGTQLTFLPAENAQTRIADDESVLGNTSSRLASRHVARAADTA